MSAILGRTQAVGLGKETTAGTAVAATEWIPIQESTVEDVKDAIYDDSGLGTRHKNFGEDVDLLRAEGNINGFMYPNAMGMLLYAAMGGISTAGHAGATGAYDHTISVASNLPTITISKEDANEDVRHSYGMLNTLELTVETGSYASFASTWLARKSASASNTVSYSVEKPFRAQDVTVKIADDVASLGAADALRFKSMTLTINNNIITEPSLGTTDPDFYTGTFDCTLEFGGLYLDTSFKDLVFNNTAKAMSITFNRSDVAIGTGTPTTPQITFTFEPGYFSEWTREGGLDDLKNETTSFTPIFSTSTSKQLGVVVVNTEATY